MIKEINKENLDLSKVPRNILEEILRTIIDVESFEVPFSNAGFVILQADLWHKIDATCMKCEPFLEKISAPAKEILPFVSAKESKDIVNRGRRNIQLIKELAKTKTVAEIYNYLLENNITTRLGKEYSKTYIYSILGQANIEPVRQPKERKIIEKKPNRKNLLTEQIKKLINQKLTRKQIILEVRKTTGYSIEYIGKELTKCGYISKQALPSNNTIYIRELFEQGLSESQILGILRKENLRNEEGNPYSLALIRDKLKSISQSS